MNIKNKIRDILNKHVDFAEWATDDTECTNDILALIGVWSGEKCICNCHRGRLGKEFTLKFKYCPKCMDIHNVQ